MQSRLPESNGYLLYRGKSLFVYFAFFLYFVFYVSSPNYPINSTKQIAVNVTRAKEI